MKKYEIGYILKASLDEAARKAKIEKINSIFANNGCKVVNVNETFGLRELAYPIKKETKADSEYTMVTSTYPMENGMSYSKYFLNSYDNIFKMYNSKNDRTLLKNITFELTYGMFICKL